MPPSKIKKLTLKQARFIKEYAKDGNGTQAAVRAGYSKNSAREIASENLMKPIIKESIDEIRKKIGITHEYVLNNFKQVSDIHSKTITKTVGDGNNVYVVEEMIDATSVLKANELLGKHLKLFVDKIEIDTKIEVIEDIERKKLLAKKLLLSLQNPQLLKDLDF